MPFTIIGVWLPDGTANRQDGIISASRRSYFSMQLVLMESYIQIIWETMMIAAEHVEMASVGITHVRTERGASDKDIQQR